MDGYLNHCFASFWFSQGIKLGVSSRGWASLVSDPHTKGLVVDDDFELITFDFVADPSNSGAFLYPIHSRYRWEGPSLHLTDSLTALGSGPLQHVLWIVILIEGIIVQRFL